MIIDCISDLHGFYPDLEGGDLLLIAGDLTSNDTPKAWQRFYKWFDEQNYRKKIYICGNHDSAFDAGLAYHKDMTKHLKTKDSMTYLCDSGNEFEGLKIWGIPWSHRFLGINPHCMAFTYLDDQWYGESILSKIPDDIDILITHEPPYGILDLIKRGQHVGSRSLRHKAFSLPNLKLHAFGHIHEQGGKILDNTWTKFVNASHVDEDYQPVNKAIRIKL